MAEDIAALKSLGLSLKLDFAFNHISVLSPQFQELVWKGQASEFADFFLNRNKFWDRNGTLASNDVMQPDPTMLKGMFSASPTCYFWLCECPMERKFPTGILSIRRYDILR